MARSSGFEWVVPPDKMIARIDDLPNLIDERVGQELILEANDAQTHMRVNAGWQNITGNARRGLKVFAAKRGEKYVMWFVHTVDYGKYLELARGGTYQIVWPTVLAWLPRVRKVLKDLL